MPACDYTRVKPKAIHWIINSMPGQSSRHNPQMALGKGVLKSREGGLEESSFRSPP